MYGGQPDQSTKQCCRWNAERGMPHHLHNPECAGDGESRSNDGGPKDAQQSLYSEGDRRRKITTDKTLTIVPLTIEPIAAAVRPMVEPAATLAI